MFINKPSLVRTANFIAIVALVSGVNVVCEAKPQSMLTQHVRNAVINGQASFQGRLPATQTLRFDIVLSLSNPSDLQLFLQELYDSSSPFYKQYLSPEQFTSRFGPSQEDYNAVIAFAENNGFTVTGGSRDALDVQLQGTVANIERAFGVSMGVYQHPTENRTFFAPDREPTADLPFKLWHVSGLDNYSIPRAALIKADSTQFTKQSATTGSGPAASFLGSDMRAAYYGGPLTGAGQNIGLLEYAGYNIADVNTYYSNSGQTRNYAITGISTDGTSVSCVSPSCDDTEQTLDITQAGGMAPGVNSIMVFVGSSDTAILGAMTTANPLPASLSCSWGWEPADPGTDDPYYQKMAAQGQSFFVAAGDSDTWTSSNYAYPAEDAYITSVGGTDLTTSFAGGPWRSEVGWAYGGGGISPDHIAIPSWQLLTGVINSSNKGSELYRNGPDVSANANFTFYVCADQTACTANYYGGTSFAAPMWAGYIALANEQSASNGKSPLGFINPTLYSLGVSSSYHSNFHDITSGNNGYPAVVGYDLDSGWGSPNGANLITALLNGPGQGCTGGPVVSLSPTSLTFGSVRVGSTSAAQKITLSNTGSASLTFSAITASANFSLSTSGIKTPCVKGGTVAAGASCMINVTFKPSQRVTTSGNLTFTDNACVSTQQVPLSGTGTRGSF